MQWYNDLSGKMRHLPIKQAIRKSLVSHYRRHFSFKDGLNLAAGSDKEMAYPSGDLGVAELFFTAFSWYLNNTQEDRETNTASFPLPPVTIPSLLTALHEISEIVFLNWSFMKCLRLFR